VKTLDENKQLLFLGDNHGNWTETLYKVRSKDVTDAYIVSVGDLGIGFQPARDVDSCRRLSEEFSLRNIIFYGIRGNHDDPSYFTGNNRIVFENFELLEDYTIFKYKDRSLQFIGGAISIDRTGRATEVSHWETEGVVFKREECKPVDVLVTHTAPSYCFPQQFNEIVYGWAREDAYLIDDLIEERAVMDEILNLCVPSLHVYGHFHSSWTDQINQCKHKLLDINELWTEDSCYAK